MDPDRCLVGNSRSQWILGNYLLRSWTVALLFEGGVEYQYGKVLIVALGSHYGLTE